MIDLGEEVQTGRALTLPVRSGARHHLSYLTQSLGDCPRRALFSFFGREGSWVGGGTVIHLLQVPQLASDEAAPPSSDSTAISFHRTPVKEGK